MMSSELKKLVQAIELLEDIEDKAPEIKEILYQLDEVDVKLQDKNPDTFVS